MRSNYLAFIVLALIILSVILTQRVLLISSDNTNTPVDEKTASSSSTTRDKIKSVIGNILHSVVGHNKTTRHSSSNIEASSPREGTDIHQDNHHVILKCRNQSQCIVPDLQLLVKFKVYFCTKGVHQGYRFFFLVKEGLLLHPNVELVSFQNISQADLIVYLPASSPWHKTECSNVDFAKRLLVLEEFDGANVYRPAKTEALMKEIYGPSMRWYFMYFKRSFVHRRDGVFKDYPALSTRDIFPMVYSIGNSYSQLDFNHNRSIDITCTLRGNKQMTTRLRVQTWVAEYVNNSANRVSNAVLKELNHDTRTKISKGYFDKMFNSKIIVTVNPANWEGDFRLWESMASGALVMVDPLFVPYPHPLIDGKHVVFYDNHNKTDFMTKLDYYHKNPAEARKIAVAGYLFCMKYHRTSSMMDYFLRSAHIRMLQNSGVEERLLPKYRYTAQYLLNATQRQHHLIRKHKRPGVYEH